MWTLGKSADLSRRKMTYFQIKWKVLRKRKILDLLVNIFSLFSVGIYIPINCSNLNPISSNLLDVFLGKFLLIVKAGSSLSFWCPMLYQIVIFQIGICLFRAQCCCHHHLCSWWQRFVSSTRSPWLTRIRFTRILLTRIFKKFPFLT